VKGYSPAAGTIVAIKTVHSLIFLVNSVAVLLVFWLGLTGRCSIWLKPAPTLDSFVSYLSVFGMAVGGALLVEEPGWRGFALAKINSAEMGWMNTRRPIRAACM
jgi:hypothetical protein